MDTGTLTCLLVALCWTLLCVTPVAPAPQQPNIVLILADDLGWNDVSYHGSEIQTPYIDELAATGVKLENYYVQPICSPSRSQLLTGRYQIHIGNVHGIMQANKPMGLPAEIPTMAEKLGDAGYATHAIGKWHLGMFTPNFLPTRRGFDSFFGKLVGTGDHFNYSQCHRYDGETACGFDLYNNEEIVRGVTEYSTRLYTRKALQVLDEHDPSQPLFLYLPYQAPHTPLQVPREYEDMYAHIADENRRVYAGMVTCLDDAVRNITEALKARGMWDNTLLVFSSDNGGNERTGASNAPLRAHKGCLFDGGIRGVALLNGGLVERRGVTSTDLIHITDWFPTFLKLGGGNTEGLELDGYDIWNTISAGDSAPREEILHDMDILYKKQGDNLYPEIFDTRIRAAIRVGDWKLLTGRPDTTGRPILRRQEGGYGSPAEGGEGPRGGAGRGADDGSTRGGRGDQAGGDANQLPASSSRVRPSPPNVPRVVDVIPRTPAGEPEDKNIWLFNMIEDPNEQSDVSDQHPDIVERLLHRLAYHHSTAVTPFSPCPDSRSNPDLNGGVWGPWLAAGEEDTVEPLCEDLVPEYEEFRYRPLADPKESQGGPGTILLVVIVLICCVLLIGTILGVRRYIVQRHKKLQMEVNMDHE